MRLNFKDGLIAIMFVFIIALMGLVYKVNTLVVDRIPNRIEPEVYVMGLTEAIERQNRTCIESAHQTRWLRRHLEKCLTLIESERGLKPIPIQYDAFKDPMVGMSFTADTQKEPFVIPYEEYHSSRGESVPEEKNLMALTCLTNLATCSAQMTNTYDTGTVIIENFQKRLRRIAPDPNTMEGGK